LTAPRHCEEQRDEAIHLSASREMDCFASLAMTTTDVYANKLAVSGLEKAI